MAWMFVFVKSMPMAIHRAAKKGDLHRVRQLMEAGASMDSRNDQGRTPILVAAERGHHAVVEFLINCKLNPGTCKPPMLLDIDVENEGAIGLFLQQDEDNYTLLHFASRRGWADIAQIIIAKGSGSDMVNAATIKGRTPLILAALHEHDDVAALLLRSGADVNRRDIEGWTALHCSAYTGRVRLLKLLLQEGGLDLNPQDQDGNTPLHFACYLRSHGHREVIKQLLTAGADVNLNNRNGVTPLILAARHGHEDAAALLLRSGADVNRRDRQGWTALHWAADQNRVRLVELLLQEGGLDLNPRDQDGNTPLHFACYLRAHGHREIIKQLLAAAADVNVINRKGQTPLSICLTVPLNPSLEVINLCVQHGAFFQDRDYGEISDNPVLRWNVLKNVNLCTQSVVNKFSHETLPALYSSPYFASMLPSMDNLMLNTSQKDELKNFVRCDIQQNTLCNVVRVRPTALSALCVQCLAAYTASRQ